jgi:hypothetical protein
MREGAVVARPLNLDNGSVYVYYEPELLTLPALPAFVSFYQVTDFHSTPPQLAKHYNYHHCHHQCSGV